MQTTNNTLLTWMIVHDLHKDNTLEDVFCEFFPDIKTIQCRFNWGTFQWKIPSLGIRYIRKSSAIYIDNGWYEVPTTIARMYLDKKFPKRLRASKGQRDIVASHKTPPLMIKPGCYKDYVYVDLKAAYFTIVNTWGWNVDYYPGKWLIPGLSCSDFPLPDNKIARNCLVSFGLPSHSTVWTGTHFIRERTSNLHINLCLWTLVQDVLHNLAEQAEVYGAIYIHTDGYMIPKNNVKPFTEYIESWGLKWGIKAEGNVILCGFGNWFIGEKATKHFSPNFSKPHRYIRYISLKELKVLRKAKTSTHS